MLINRHNSTMKICNPPSSPFIKEGGKEVETLGKKFPSFLKRGEGRLQKNKMNSYEVFI